MATWKTFTNSIVGLPRLELSRTFHWGPGMFYLVNADVTSYSKLSLARNDVTVFHWVGL